MIKYENKTIKNFLKKPDLIKTLVWFEVEEAPMAYYLSIHDR